MVVPFLLGCSMYWNSPRTVEVEIKPVVVEEPVEEKEFNYEEYIKNLRIQYNNQDILQVMV